MKTEQILIELEMVNSVLHMLQNDITNPEGSVLEEDFTNVLQLVIDRICDVESRLEVNAA